MSTLKTSIEAVEKRIESGEIIHQNMADFIRELNSVSEERLNAVALSDGVREYTYRQVFRKWEEYAEGFTAADICGENGSRVGLYAFGSIEIIFALYGLNMTGASVSMLFVDSLFDWDILKRTVKTEGLTDLVLLDNLMIPDIYNKLMQKKRSLGLRNVIMLHTDLNIPFLPQRIVPLTNMSAQFVSRNPRTTYLEEFVAPGMAAGIQSETITSEESSIILHTSGTTSGIRKPIPYANSAINEGAARFLRNPEFREMFEGTAVSMLGAMLNACYFMIDQLHLPLAFGGKVFTAPFSEFDQKHFLKYYEENGVNISFVAPMLFGDLNKVGKADLSKLKLCALGGSYVSPDRKAKIDEFLKDCGMKTGSCIGYGLSEAGGAVFLADPGMGDTIGRPLPGIKVKLFDEEEEKYYSIEDGKRRGVLFVSTPSMSSGRIGDTVFFEHVEIDGEPYINTYDLMEVNEDGTLTCVGRMNKFFKNSKGVKFDAGLVERAFAAQKGIADCGIAPEFLKAVNDTVPVLYVKINDATEEEAQEIVKTALTNVYIKEKELEESNLPVQCVIAEEIPYTDTGKVNVHKISDQTVKGNRYTIRAEHEGNELTGFTLNFVSPDTRHGPAEVLAQNPSPLSAIFNFVSGKSDDLNGFGFPMEGQMPGGFQNPGQMSGCGFPMFGQMPGGFQNPGQMSGFGFPMFGQMNGTPKFPQGSKRGKKMPGGEASMMQFMPYFFTMMQNGMQGMPEMPEMPCCSGRKKRSDKDTNRRPCRRRFDDEACEGKRRRRRRPPYPPFFRMMQQMSEDAWDYDTEEEELTAEAEENANYDYFPPFPPCFRFMQQMQDEEEDEQEERRCPFPKPDRSRFPKSGKRPPFPCFMQGEEDADEQDADDETQEDEKENGMPDVPAMGPICNILSKLFYASDYDEFYED